MLGNLIKQMEKRQSNLSGLQIQSQFTVYDEKIPQIPKKSIHPIIFILNVGWMLACCYSSLFYIYGGSQTSTRIKKGIVAAVILGYTLVVAIPTIFYLINLKEFLRLLVLLDAIMVVSIAAALAFLNLMFIFDTTDDWYWSMIEAGFSIGITFISTMSRVFLVHLKWPKWQLIFFKLSTMANCLMYFICGVYFIVVNYTYTRHRLPAFDNKVHDFMVLFIFSMFAYAFELYSKITDLDRTGDLKYIYSLKNFDQNLDKKKKNVIKNKRQSIQSIQMLQQFNQLNKIHQQVSKPSRFAQIQILENGYLQN